MFNVLKLLKKHSGVFLFFILGLAVLHSYGQIFIPFGFWGRLAFSINNAPTISTITNRNIYEGNYPFIPFTISDPEDILSCTILNLSRTSSNVTVVPLTNITFTGAVPFCYVNIVPATGVSGTSTIGITINDNGSPNLQATTTFTVTAFTIQSLSVIPVLTIIPQNTTFKYTALATYSDSTSQDVSSFATWSENTTVTTIDSSGLLTVGTVTGYPTLTVSATYAPYSAQGTATLNSSTITSLFTTPTAITINPGNVQQIKCYALTADGGTLDVTSSCVWTTSQSSIANVNDYFPKGEMTAYAVGGPVTIAATFGSVSDTTLVTVASGTQSTTVEGIGLFARYFTGMGFTTFFRQRVDNTVNFTWDTANNPAGNADTFSVRWTGQIRAPETGTYQFFSNSDDGFRLWVNNTLLEDFWTDHGPTNSNSNTISLVAGTDYTIVVEFYENGGNAFSQLAWKVPSSGCSSFGGCPIVPRTNLFPDSGYGMRLDLAGNTDTNPGNRNFLNDNFVRFYDADGTGSIASGTTIVADVGGASGTLTALNANGTGFSYTTGLINQAFSFDGVDDSFTAPNTSLSTGTNARGASLWIKPVNTGSAMGVFFYGADTDNNGFGLIVRSTGVVRVNGGGSQNCDSTNAVNWSAWNHVAIRRVAGNSNVSVYLNGTATSCGNRNWNTSAGNLLLGRHPSQGNNFSGEIDEFGLWSADIAANGNNFLPSLIYQRQNPTPSYSP
jgi:hypothetical protein